VRIYVRYRLEAQEIEKITAEGLLYNLERFADQVGNPDARAFSRDHIEEWRRKTSLAPSTVRNRIGQLRGFTRWAVEHGHLKRDPMIGVRPPRQPRHVPRNLQSKDVTKVFEVACDSRARLAVSLMVQEGLRRKEVAGIEVGDIDFDAGCVLIRGKGGHERVVPISDETRGLLVRYLREYPASAGPLIRSQRDGRSAVQPVTIGRLVSALMLEAGVKERPYDGRTPHALRHTAATDMLRAGAHIRDVQAALGHKSITSTERYLAWEVAGLRSAMGGRTYLPPAS
jgi:site-specific recombinase XerD